MKRTLIASILSVALLTLSAAAVENPFTDVSSDSSLYNAVLWAVEEGITTGTSGTTFSPDTTCTDEQVITFLHRAMGAPESEAVSALTAEAPDYAVAAISWADETGLLSDMDFAAGTPSPRSDIVTYLYRDAGSPEVTIDIVEEEVAEEEVVEEDVVVEEEVVEEVIPETSPYAYTMPQVSDPGTTGVVSSDYFEQMFLYMMVNDLETYECYFDGSGSSLESQGLATVINDACFYIKDSYIELGGFYAGYGWQWSSNGKATTVTISLTGENLSHSQVVSYKATFLSDIETLVTGFFDSGVLNDSDSDSTKAFYFYQWCALNLKYDTHFMDSSYYGYGTLLNGTGVCQGYVSVFNAMCNCAGIEATGVTGYAEGEGHIWSYLNLDGSWLYADPTFGDPIPDTAGYCDPSYFAVTKDFLSATHVFDAAFA